MPANDNWSNKMRKKAAAQCVVSQFLVAHSFILSSPLPPSLSRPLVKKFLLQLDLEIQLKFLGISEFYFRLRAIDFSLAEKRQTDKDR